MWYFDKCRLIEPVQPPLSLETPNDVPPVAQQSKNIQATSKDSDQADPSLCWSHIPHCWISNATAQFILWH